jgi:hypothetical protein
MRGRGWFTFQLYHKEFIVSTEYKVWVHVEECDDETDHYEEVGLPDCLGTFNGLDEADEFVETLLQLYAPEQIATSDRVIHHPIT